ncbi:MAG: TonB-dependent receptor [Pseudohongiellaceae bacterium]
MPQRQFLLTRAITVITTLLAGQLAAAADIAGPVTTIEEIIVWGQAGRQQAGNAHPSSLLTQQDLVSINVATTEDVVKFEPSLVIRRRFIGDSNGTMGMRGSNMFQTSRSMVFADGVPLHYLLQSRWNGAPRWTMVSASEIAQVEVLYGPFSAEYSGNSMGGVVLIESAIPQQREFHFDSSYYSQRFAAYGFDDRVNGYKTFMSYGDKLGDLSVYLSYNRLENDSQPQTFYFGASSNSTAAIPVNGAIDGRDEFGNARLWFGDTGVVATTTDNYKLKLGYDFGPWQTLLNVAYEDRLADAGAPNAYVRDAAGTSVYRGNVVQNGGTINIPAARLGLNEQERDSLSLGLRLRGPVSETVTLEANLNQFNVLRDETRASLANPADPAYNLNGQVTDFGATGWQSAEAKLTFSELGVPGLNLVTGLRYEAYELNLDVFNSDNWEAASFTGFASRSGGATTIAAIFAQLNWVLDEQWEMSLGGRYESFESRDGYFSRDLAATPQYDLVEVPGDSNRKFSPKFSLGYQLNDQWRLGYALGRAYRFPIVEELFSQYQAYNAVSVANPALHPENGLHHNLMIDRQIPGGTLRVNLFQESIEDVIESQSDTLPGGLTVRTFVPVDEIETRGVEFIVNADDLLLSNLDVRFNMAYTDSEIVRNRPDPSIEGNVYPRMPKWRSNLLATYHLSNQWDAGLNMQYASDSFGRNDNTDRENEVYGAQDGFSRLGLKTSYRFDTGLSLGLGVDNLTDETSYVAHPWPGRTIYANLAYDF